MTEDKKCCVCNWRKAEALRRTTCRKCAILTASEGTREQYGLPKPRPSLTKTAPAFVASYNKMLRAGYTISKIVVETGLSWRALKNRVQTLRSMGYEIDEHVTKEDRRRKPQPPLQNPHPRVTNEHGGGRTGVARCQCQLCIDRRALTQKEWRNANPDKMRQYRDRQNLQQQQQIAEAGLRRAKGKGKPL